MIIDCISDLHGFYPKLEGGDLLIVAGDLTARDLPSEYDVFASWIKEQPYKKRIVIAGNHDLWIECAPVSVKNLQELGGFEYLCDSGTEFEGLKIWGSPWTKTFPGINPHCKAFTLDTEEELAHKWALIPEDTDILITHSPLLGTLDLTATGDCVGSLSLAVRIGEVNPKLHVFGHIHECGGKVSDGRGLIGLPGYFDVNTTIFVNASHVDERYEPVNKPIRILL